MFNNDGVLMIDGMSGELSGVPVMLQLGGGTDVGEVGWMSCPKLH